MARTSLAPLIAPEFDKFLTATVGRDRHGGLLSVLSALARLDVDPWQETETLAKMPADRATLHLAELLGALPEAPTIGAPVATLAAELICLLPRRTGDLGGLPRLDRLLIDQTGYAFGFGLIGLLGLIALLIPLLLGHFASPASGIRAAENQTNEAIPSPHPRAGP